MRYHLTAAPPLGPGILFKLLAPQRLCPNMEPMRPGEGLPPQMPPPAAHTPSGTQHLLEHLTPPWSC